MNINQESKEVKYLKMREIISLLNATVICGEAMLDDEVEYAFASDLMSDVLTLKTENMLLVTGLGNIQTIRTAEMSDINKILFVRRKKVTEEMKELAEDNDMLLIECDYSMFRAVGILYQAGLNPIY